MICTWTVSDHLGLHILLFVEVMICSTEAHSVILLNDLYMDSSVSSGFTNFAICGSDNMYHIQLICFVEHHLHNKINGCAFKGCDLLNMASYHKKLAVKKRRSPINYVFPINYVGVTAPTT